MTNLSILCQVIVVLILKHMYYSIPYFSTHSLAKEYTIPFTVNLNAELQYRIDFKHFLLTASCSVKRDTVV